MHPIDLHTHSTRSDGTLTPAELIRYAAQKGLAAIALTDHDTIDGIEEAVQAARSLSSQDPDALVPNIMPRYVSTWEKSVKANRTQATRTTNIV